MVIHHDSQKSLFQEQAHGPSQGLWCSLSCPKQCHLWTMRGLPSRRCIRINSLERTGHACDSWNLKRTNLLTTCTNTDRYSPRFLSCEFFIDYGKPKQWLFCPSDAELGQGGSFSSPETPAEQISRRMKDSNSHNKGYIALQTQASLFWHNSKSKSASTTERMLLFSTFILTALLLFTRSQVLPALGSNAERVRIVTQTTQLKAVKSSVENKIRRLSCSQCTPDEDRHDPSRVLSSSLSKLDVPNQPPGQNKHCSNPSSFPHRDRAPLFSEPMIQNDLNGNFLTRIFHNKITDFKLSRRRLARWLKRKWRSLARFFRRMRRRQPAS
ncbi:hypothetical protein O181_086139 [Austropuccinia psidii MF-1]|uniref:Uncharacterized protein n=1 Tax=Austropuccinia psidii MF-1 TaxID=1389203 RepID=A0A9Q3FWK7_9BASI|nr:hypothetical protein [Austropuccinia psidii MF-1]